VAVEIHAEVWLTTLAGMGLVALAFLYVIAQSGKPADSAQVQKKASAIRPWWFLALTVLGIGVTWASLKQFPIPDQHAQSQAQIVNAVARQWSWELSENRFTAGVPVEFRVTSADVNHGFAIYDPAGRIVTQTQAMPGFANRLVHTFAQPGKYRVLCLEYCGLAHHGMLAEFEVTAAAGSRP
jgi:cytochrome c oxidase subunit II